MGDCFLGKNRDRISIIGAILEAAGPGASKTRIMAQANLSFNLLEKYLALTNKAGFVQLIDYKYAVTQRGKNFLKEYKHFYERYDKAQKILESLDTERERLAKICDGCGLDNSVRAILESEQ
jgi:predicted transcriptional regulator